MSIEIGSIFALIGVDVDGVDEGVKKAQDKLKAGGERLRSIGSSLSTYVTAPIVAAGGGILMLAGQFEASMNRVAGAIGEKGAPFLDQLRDKAKELGATTIYSASQSADAIEMLIKNGLDSAAVLGGAADATVALAAATGSDLARAADIATDAMQSFSDVGGNVKGAVDGIVGSTLASKFGIEDYAAALGQAGGAAGALGVEFNDFNTVLAATASSFGSGSDAGTSFKVFLQRLKPQSDEATAAMKQLGLVTADGKSAFYDAQGALKPMNEIVGLLSGTFGRMTEEQRNAFGATIFGQDAMRTAFALARTGREDFEKLADEVGRTGQAQEQADARTRGLVGAWEEFKSAIENLALSIADAGLLKWATDFIGKATEIVNGLAETNPALLTLGTVIAGIAAAVGPAVWALGTLATSVAAGGALGTGLGLLKAAFLAIFSVPAGLIIAAVVAGAVVIVKNWDWIKERALWLKDQLNEIWNAATDRWDQFTYLFKSDADLAKMVAFEKLQGKAKRLGLAIEELKSSTQDDLKNFNLYMSDARKRGVLDMELLENESDELKRRLVSAAKEAGIKIIGLGKDVTKGAKDAKEGAEKHMPGVTDAIGAARDKAKEHFEKIVEFAESTAQALGDIAVEKAGAIEAKWKAVAEGIQRTYADNLKLDLRTREAIGLIDSVTRANLEGMKTAGKLLGQAIDEGFNQSLLDAKLDEDAHAAAQKVSDQLEKDFDKRFGLLGTLDNITGFTGAVKEAFRGAFSELAGDLSAYLLHGEGSVVGIFKQLGENLFELIITKIIDNILSKLVDKLLEIIGLGGNQNDLSKASGSPVALGPGWGQISDNIMGISAGAGFKGVGMATNLFDSILKTMPARAANALFESVFGFEGGVGGSLKNLWEWASQQFGGGGNMGDFPGMSDVLRYLFDALRNLFGNGGFTGPGGGDWNWGGDFGGGIGQSMAGAFSVPGGFGSAPGGSSPRVGGNTYNFHFHQPVLGNRDFIQKVGEALDWRDRNMIRGG